MMTWSQDHLVYVEIIQIVKSYAFSIQNINSINLDGTFFVVTTGMSDNRFSPGKL